jgi:hypothetical protein
MILQKLLAVKESAVVGGAHELLPARAELGPVNLNFDIHLHLPGP